MEVHHHPHTAPMAIGRKKITHYLWEFLMLFLAVFFGFIQFFNRSFITLNIYHENKNISFIPAVVLSVNNSNARFFTTVRQH
jgi:hypothetical protein